MSLSNKVHNFAILNFGQKVGSGECFDLADSALKKLGAKTAKDYGKITATADYIWGQLINYQKAVRGDIIQFNGYGFEVTITEKDYSPYKQRYSESRPHHTAIVSNIKSNGEIIVLEQNVDPDGRKVQKHSLYFGSPAPIRKGKETINIRVFGTAKFYRPQK